VCVCVCVSTRQTHNLELEPLTAKKQQRVARDEKRLMIQTVTTPNDNRTSIIPGNPEVIQIRMESNETVEVEPGAMCFMTPGVSMITSLGENNLVSGVISGLKRVAGGENFFIKCVWPHSHPTLPLPCTNYQLRGLYHLVPMWFCTPQHASNVAPVRGCERSGLDMEHVAAMAAASVSALACAPSLRTA
jgi:hypothetical protein